MSIDLDEQLRKTEEDMNTAVSALLRMGFPHEQLEQLSIYIHAKIAHSQYAMVRATREIKAESAMKPGGFQTKVL